MRDCIWATPSAKGMLKEVGELIQANTREGKPIRMIVVTAGAESKPLQRFVSGMGITEKFQQIIDNPDELTTMSVDGGNRNNVVFLRTLVPRSLSVWAGVEMLNSYAKNYGFAIQYMPWQIKKIDINCMAAEPLFDSGNGSTWLTDIAHTFALAISQGVPECYKAILYSFKSRTEQMKGYYMPSAQECMDECITMTACKEEFKLICHEMSAQDLDRMLNFPENFENRWKVLWSAGLAIHCSGRWQLAPALLEQYSYNRVITHCLIEANNKVIPRIYMAWVAYCEEKYRMPERRGNHKLAVYYPADVDDYLVSRSQKVDRDDIPLSHRVRLLRNWLHHIDQDNEEKDLCCPDHHHTCMEIITMMDPTGRRYK